jgi:hypothetical protein
MLSAIVDVIVMIPDIITLPFWIPDLIGCPQLT